MTDVDNKKKTDAHVTKVTKMIEEDYPRKVSFIVMRKKKKKKNSNP